MAKITILWSIYDNAFHEFTCKLMQSCCTYFSYVERTVWADLRSKLNVLGVRVTCRAS